MDALLGKFSPSPSITSVVLSYNSSLTPSTWLLDFGSSHHLTSSENQVPNVNPYSDLEDIVVVW